MLRSNFYGQFLITLSASCEKSKENNFSNKHQCCSWSGRRCTFYCINLLIPLIFVMRFVCKSFFSVFSSSLSVFSSFFLFFLFFPVFSCFFMFSFCHNFNAGKSVTSISDCFFFMVLQSLMKQFVAEHWVLPFQIENTTTTHWKLVTSCFAIRRLFFSSLVFGTVHTN